MLLLSDIVVTSASCVKVQMSVSAGLCFHPQCACGTQKGAMGEQNPSLQPLMSSYTTDVTKASDRPPGGCRAEFKHLNLKKKILWCDVD